MTQLLTCENITRKFKHFALKDIRFSLESGYLTGLVGRNSSGKTALLRILAGLDTHYQGTLEINGISVKNNPQQIKNLVGYVSEDLQPFWEKTALENGSILGPYFENYEDSYYQSWLNKLHVNPKLPVHQMSKGNRMKYFLCFALAHHPQLLILDEPSAGFDPVFRKEFLTILQGLVENNITVLMASHITEDLDKVADYILYLDQGCLTGYKSIEQVRAKNHREKLADSDSFRGTIRIGDLLR